MTVIVVCGSCMLSLTNNPHAWQVPPPPSTETLDEAVKGIREELDSMVGMHDVKQTVCEIIDKAVADSFRRELGMPTEPLKLHMLAVGSPGTGKTTTSRQVGTMLRRIGLLRTGEFVEVSREKLVAQYEGQTAKQTVAALDSARGGILFVDEAHQLVSGREDAYGKEALGTIVKYMEDHRDDVCVIFAGYMNKIEGLLAYDPGLRSRFPITLTFADYSGPELVSIATSIATGMLHLLHFTAPATSTTTTSNTPTTTTPTTPTTTTTTIPDRKGSSPGE